MADAAVAGPNANDADAPASPSYAQVLLSPPPAAQAVAGKRGKRGGKGGKKAGKRGVTVAAALGQEVDSDSDAVEVVEEDSGDSGAGVGAGVGAVAVPLAPSRMQPIFGAQPPQVLTTEPAALDLLQRLVSRVDSLERNTTGSGSGTNGTGNITGRNTGDATEERSLATLLDSKGIPLQKFARDLSDFYQIAGGTATWEDWERVLVKEQFFGDRVMTLKVAEAVPFPLALADERFANKRGLSAVAQKSLGFTDEVLAMARGTSSKRHMHGFMHVQACLEYLLEFLFASAAQDCLEVPRGVLEVLNFGLFTCAAWRTETKLEWASEEQLTKEMQVSTEVAKLMASKLFHSRAGSVTFSLVGTGGSELVQEAQKMQKDMQKALAAQSAAHKNGYGNGAKSSGSGTGFSAPQRDGGRGGGGNFGRRGRGGGRGFSQRGGGQWRGNNNNNNNRGAGNFARPLSASNSTSLGGPPSVNN